MNTETSEKPTCELCGVPFRKKNPHGVCSRNPECAREYHRRYQAHLRMNGRDSKHSCLLCGKPLNRGNEYGICQSNCACRNEYNRRHTAAHRDELNERQRRRRGTQRIPCELCGNPILASRKHGVCTRNDECRREYFRRRAIADRLARPALLAENKQLRKWVNDLQSVMYINCVYCGHRYGPRHEIPASMASVLKEHVKQCPKHPMSILYAACRRLAEDTSLPYKWHIPIKEALEQVDAL